MANDADKFSHLPDDIIVLIISFLPFIDAYRLCLSRKDWREKALWLYCTCLDLHEIHFLLPGTRQYWLSIGKRVQSMEMKRIGKIRYVDFLNKTVTNLASPSLSKFSFRFYYSSDRYHENIDKWIKVALSKGVKELSIDFSDGDPLEPQPMLLTPQYVLPNFLYQDGMCLKVLNISSCGLGYCNFQGFIRLRTLTLTRVRLFWGEIEHMVLSCPYLETMSLVECYRLIKVHISFVFLRLKKFILRHCLPLTLGVELCLPKLQYFEYAGRMVQFCLSQLFDLHEVILDYHTDAYYPYDAEDIRSLFAVFADARILKVGTSALKIFPSEYLLCGQPVFHMLRMEHLTLRSGLELFELPAIICLLRSSPQLKTLSIFTGYIRSLHECTPKGYPRLPEGLWTADGWTLDNLERVEMHGFTGKKHEIDLVKFILKNARFLDKVIIKQLIRGTSSITSEAVVEIKNAAFAYGNAVIKWT